MNSEMGAKATLKSTLYLEQELVKGRFANVLIPEGKYRARFQEYKTYKAWSDFKLSMDFFIVDEGPYFGVVLQRYHSVLKVGKKGWKPRSATCSLMIEWFTCHPDSPRDIRRDRLPMSRWRESEYEVSVRTVKNNFQGKKLPKKMWYSKVADVLGRV